jgi:ABC-type glycerol-3-phosphate transport system substrate-binding protein
MSNFQTVLVAVFLAFFVFAVLIFSGAIKLGDSSKSSGTLSGRVVIWGTFPNSSMSEVLTNIGSSNKDLNITYVNKNISTYQQDLIEAFANNKGPDLFIITPDMIARNNNFIYKIPYVSYPQKLFQDTFMDGASIYTDSEGVVGIPLVVDPLVLYYNKDILSNEGLVAPIKTWDELFTLNSVLTKKDNSGFISRSMIALGQYGNVTNVKDILASLLIQNDNPIVRRRVDEQNRIIYTSLLNTNPSRTSVSPMEAVIRFFTEFSNPSNTAYSWNRSLPSSLDMFTSGKLAFYIGRASELFKIESINPNLSFDVTDLPQIKDSPTKRTYGEIYGVVINKRSSNLSSAFGVIGAFSQGENAKSLSVALSIPPTLRALLADKPTDNPYLFTFFNSALISRSWLDPDKEKSSLIFQELIENVLSNNLSVNEAIGKAQGQLELLLNN